MNKDNEQSNKKRFVGVLENPGHVPYLKEFTVP